MIGALRLGALGIGMLVFQALLTALLPLGFRPDVVLVFAAAMGLQRGREMQGLVFAFGIGFAMDVMSGSPLGLYALLRGTACAATRVLDRALYVSTPLSWALYCGVYWVVDWLAVGLILQFLQPAAALPWAEIARNAPGAAVLTALVASALLGLFRRIDSGSERDTDWDSFGRGGQRVRP